VTICFKQHRQLGGFFRLSQLKICLNTNSLVVILLVAVENMFQHRQLGTYSASRSENMFEHQQLGSYSVCRSENMFERTPTAWYLVC
jgi:hypothetical protein